MGDAFRILENIGILYGAGSAVVALFLLPKKLLHLLPEQNRLRQQIESGPPLSLQMFAALQVALAAILVLIAATHWAPNTESVVFFGIAAGHLTGAILAYRRRLVGVVLPTIIAVSILGFSLASRDVGTILPANALAKDLLLTGLHAVITGIVLFRAWPVLKSPASAVVKAGTVAAGLLLIGGATLAGYQVNAARQHFDPVRTARDNFAVVQEASRLAQSDVLMNHLIWYGQCFDDVELPPVFRERGAPAHIKLEAAWGAWTEMSADVRAFLMVRMAEKRLSEAHRQGVLVTALPVISECR